MDGDASKIDAGGSPPGGRPAPGPARRRLGGARMHHLLFLALMLLAGIPLAVLSYWEARTSYQNELDSVRERHLLVARNLTSTMSRYVNDLKAAFALTFVTENLAAPPAGLANLLRSLDVMHVAIVRPDGSIEAEFTDLSTSEQHANPPSPRLQLLRDLVKEKPGEPVISPLFHDEAGRTIFYIATALKDGRLGVGIVTTKYLVTLQKAIAFGDHGHAVLTDGKGQVIAHPLKDWVAAAKDLSGVPVVSAMMRGETGVGQFWSPAFNSMMIAGYSVVPETGWGVMVPQPITELERRANQVNRFALVIAGATFAAAALLSYLIAFWFSAPVRRIAGTAEAVIEGNEEVSAPPAGRLAPSEIRALSLAFNTMLSGLRQRAAGVMDALRQAETSNRAKTQFLANMSHELRTPLNGVVGTLELLRLSGLSRTHQAYVDQANRSAQSLLRMVTDVLDLSDMEVSGIELTAEPFRVDSVAEAIRAQFQESMRAKRLNFAVWVQDQARMTVIGDQRKTIRILGNLIDNAVKFTKAGGVALRISVQPEGETETKVRIRFEVGDTGIGIPTEQQARIFEAFTQGDSSNTRRYGGSGLGLAIVRELTQRMGGQIGVQSIEGVGSTFFVVLPFEKALMATAPVPPDRHASAASAAPVAIAPPPAVRQAPAETAPAPAMTAARAAEQRPRRQVKTPAARAFRERLQQAGRSTLRILLVEDNPANLRVTSALLETLGCDVTPAANGIEAVAAYKDADFDLVLMDCQMPEMDGYRATQEIRRFEATAGRSTPVVALTAHAMDGSREECMAAGMDDQLSKPLTLAALTDKLTEWLNRGVKRD